MLVAGSRVRGATLAYVFFEDLAILGCLLGAFAFAHRGRVVLLRSPLGLLHAAALVAGLKAVFFFAGLYEFRHRPTRRVFWRRLATGLAIVSGIAWANWCLVLDEKLAFATFLVGFVPVVVLGRVAYEWATRTRRFRKRLLFLGIGGEARRTAREIIDLRSRDYEVAGFLSEREEERAWRIGGRPVLGTYADLQRVVAKQNIEKVVVAVPDRRKHLPLDALLRVRLAGVEILEEPRLHEETAGKIPVEDLRPSWLIFSKGFSQGRLRLLTKRAFDIGAATVGLVVSAPLMLLTALAIKLESEGPVIYRQKRVGRSGKEFTLYKFRSMRVDAEAAGKPTWAKEDDPRQTRVGRILRKTRIDEIPQMWNVLKGTMSFVGPRPERLFFVEELRKKIPFYDQRHALKPGLTGWAQVRFRYGSDDNDAVEKLRFDMFYIKHHSILLDLRILLETIVVVFRRDMGR